MWAKSNDNPNNSKTKAGKAPASAAGTKEKAAKVKSNEAGAGNDEE